ncbi:MAG TPA: LysM peptidoglycan-binding domain-containing protein [Pseudobacteroides sp.]|uniref:cell division suppressor protein YneA n=1 Tax=Pseudobacteroides sp. TaxID=1968840 RepID=UPI002F95835E
MKKKYTLKNKKRFFTFLFLILGIMITFVFADISYGIKKKEYKLIEIKYGDTLWDIADRYRGSIEIRKFLYEIKKANSLDSSEIYTGDTLKIPVAG